MTDPRDQPDDPEVARLLADLAAAPEPLPPEVAARLDETLAGLVRERPVVPLVAPAGAATPRHRRWPAALLAAAAVLVGGYAVGEVVTGTGQSADSSAAGDARAAESAPDEDRLDAGGLADTRPEADVPEAADRSAAVPQLRSQSLRRDVRRALAEGKRVAARDEAHPGSAGDSAGLRSCRTPAVRPADRRLLVRYDGRLASLVVDRPVRGRVTAAIYACDGRLLATTTLPGP